MTNRTTERTTLTVRKRPTKDRFDEVKPEGLSADEFVQVLISRWEGHR